MMTKLMFRDGLGSKGFCDGSKGLCDIPYKKIQKAPKIPPKSPFFDILYWKGHCDQSLMGHYGQSAPVNVKYISVVVVIFGAVNVIGWKKFALYMTF
jgi:hypothetical protein